jgi:hypothetical protein
MIVMNRMTEHPTFAHPLGEFPIAIRPRGAELLCQALLRSQTSYIALDLDRLDPETRLLALRFIEVCEQLTNGLLLAQAVRERSRLGLGELHAKLVERGCHVLGGRIELASVHEDHAVFGQWTELSEITAAVITDVAISEATILMPAGKVAPQSAHSIAPTREMEWGD